MMEVRYQECIRSCEELMINEFNYRPDEEVELADVHQERDGVVIVEIEPEGMNEDTENDIEDGGKCIGEESEENEEEDYGVDEVDRDNDRMDSGENGDEKEKYVYV